MRTVLAIVRKELQIYLVSPIAYVVTILYILINSFFFSYITVQHRESDLRGIFINQNIFFLLFLIPAITMRLISEEKRAGTIEVMLTAPVTDWQVVLGKYISAMSMFAMMFVLTVYYPIVLTIFGDPEISVIVSGYIGLFLVASFFIAVGVFSSALTQNQILSFVISFIILFFFWLMGSLGEVHFFRTIPYGRHVMSYLGMSSHFDDFTKGIVDTGHIFYFGSLSFLFLFMAKNRVESRKWS